MTEETDLPPSPASATESFAQPADEGEPLYGLSDRTIDQILDALHDGRDEALLAALDDLGAADAAELLSKITDDDRKALLSRFGAAFDAYTFSELPADLRETALEALPGIQVARVLSELDSDDALDLLIDLEPEFQAEIVQNLSAKLRVTLEEGLSFPEDSAGRLMQREFVAIPQFWTVGKTIDYLRAAASDLPDEFFDIFVITPTYRVIGIVPLNRILRSMRSVKLDAIKLEDIHPVPATMDQEEVAELFRREDLSSTPVVDDEGRLIGVITIDDVVDVIDEEAQEDILKFSGVGESDIYRPVMATSLMRSRWLLVNLFTALAAAIVVSLFSATIEKVVALAALMPIVAGMGGNAGTQTLAVIVRALAMREVSGTNARRAIVKEAGVGLMNGMIFSALVGTGVVLWFGNPALGLVIGMALIVNLLIAGIFGALIPVLLDRMDQDPAISSSIFLTAFTDVVGFFAFLGLATLFLA